MKAVPRPVIAGNWKMHKTPEEAASFIGKFAAAFAVEPRGTLVFFPPALSFAATRAAGADRADFLLGVQNIHWEANGAFTGEVSAEMAAAAGARFVLAGHSERRHVFGETDDMVAKKAAAAFRAGLTPIVCVGELLEERRAGRVAEVILRQLDVVLGAVSKERAGALLVAYEPVWAIGTGVNATPADAAQAHGVLRQRLTEVVGAVRAAQVPILYGGSVKPENAAQLLAANDVDGLLVGGASLDPEAFAAIARAGRTA